MFCYLLSLGPQSHDINLFFVRSCILFVKSLQSVLSRERSINTAGVIRRYDKHLTFECMLFAIAMQEMLNACVISAG